MPPIVLRIIAGASVPTCSADHVLGHRIFWQQYWAQLQCRQALLVWLVSHDVHVQVYACVDDSLQLTDCGSSSEACRSRTLTVPSLSSHQQAQMHSDGPVLSRALKTSNAGCSHSRIQCEP